MNTSGKINYIEIPCSNMTASKSFFSHVFGWEFIDYSPEYVAFNNAGIDGGFFQSEQTSSTHNGSVLVVLYSDNLEQTLSEVSTAGADIINDIFSFPGGRRFHFSDPSGNEFAVWSDIV